MIPRTIWMMLRSQRSVARARTLVLACCLLLLTLALSTSVCWAAQLFADVLVWRRA